MPTQGNSSRVTLMPKFEGLKKWRVRDPAPTQKIAFEPMAAALAKAMGQRRSLAEERVALAKQVRCAGRGKSMVSLLSHARGRRFFPPANSRMISMVYAAARETRGCAQDCSNPKTVWPRIFSSVMAMAKRRKPARRLDCVQVWLAFISLGLPRVGRRPGRPPQAGSLPHKAGRCASLA